MTNCYFYFVSFGLFFCFTDAFITLCFCHISAVGPHNQSLFSGKTIINNQILCKRQTTNLKQLTCFKVYRFPNRKKQKLVKWRRSVIVELYRLSKYCTMIPLIHCYLHYFCWLSVFRTMSSMCIIYCFLLRVLFKTSPLSKTTWRFGCQN
jgi:hypothetical protein